MISDGLVLVFKKIYLVMKMNLMFVFFSLGGLIVLGVGPSLQMTMEIYQHYEKKGIQYNFKTMLDLFKKAFVTANIVFWSCIGVIMVLLYNIYLTTQIRAVWAAPLLLFIVFVLVMFMIFSVVIFQILASFDAKIKDVLKMSVYIFFSDFKTVLKLFISLIMIVGISSYYMGLLMFITFGALVLVADKVLRSGLNDIKFVLEGAYEE